MLTILGSKPLADAPWMTRTVGGVPTASGVPSRGRAHQERGGRAVFFFLGGGLVLRGFESMVLETALAGLGCRFCFTL